MGGEDVCDITMNMKNMKGQNGECGKDPEADQCAPNDFSMCTMRFRFDYGVSQECVSAKACTFMQVDAYHNPKMPAPEPLKKAVTKVKNKEMTKRKKPGVKVPCGCGLQTKVLRVQCTLDGQ